MHPAPVLSPTLHHTRVVTSQHYWYQGTLRPIPLLASANMEAPNDDSQPPQGSVATGSQQQDEGAIAHDIMKTVMEEQAYQDLSAKLSALEEEVVKERKEKEEAISGKNELGMFLSVDSRSQWLILSSD
jgi:hypothetical protein